MTEVSGLAESGFMGSHPNPVFGTPQIPHTGVGFRDSARMEETTRKILADNLRALMERTAIDTFPKIIAAGGPSNGTLDRIRRQAAGTSVDNLEKLAAVYGVQPWQLLAPDMAAHFTVNPTWEREAREAAAELGNSQITGPLFIKIVDIAHANRIQEASKPSAPTGRRKMT